MAKKHFFSVWPIPQEFTSGLGHFVLSSPLSLTTHGDADWLLETSRRAAEVLNQAAGGVGPLVVEEEGGGTTWHVMTMEALTPGLKPVMEDEGYVLDVTGSGVWLAGRDARGVFYGA